MLGKQLQASNVGVPGGKHTEREFESSYSERVGVNIVSMNLG